MRERMPVLEFPVPNLKVAAIVSDPIAWPMETFEMGEFRRGKIAERLPGPCRVFWGEPAWFCHGSKIDGHQGDLLGMEVKTHETFPGVGFAFPPSGPLLLLPPDAFVDNFTGDYRADRTIQLNRRVEGRA